MQDLPFEAYFFRHTISVSIHSHGRIVLESAGMPFLHHMRPVTKTGGKEGMNDGQQE